MMLYVLILAFLLANAWLALKAVDEKRFRRLREAWVGGDRGFRRRSIVLAAFQVVEMIVGTVAMVAPVFNGRVAYYTSTVPFLYAGGSHFTFNPVLLYLIMWMRAWTLIRFVGGHTISGVLLTGYFLVTAPVFRDGAFALKFNINFLPMPYLDFVYKWAPASGIGVNLFFLFLTYLAFSHVRIQRSERAAKVETSA